MNVGRRIRFAGLDLEGDALAVAPGQKIYGLSAANGGLFADFVSLPSQVAGQVFAPVLMLLTSVAM